MTCHDIMIIIDVTYINKIKLFNICKYMSTHVYECINENKLFLIDIGKYEVSSQVMR